ncbi:MAG: hypothetical protein HYT75_01145 [Deltaproteobacteria bacterium]|nr:hypothetical protein [Deltaproteobacteria bacterium]
MDKKKKDELAKTCCGPKVTTEKSSKKQKWEKPSLENVSTRVMAQPYIRFT